MLTDCHIGGESEHLEACLTAISETPPSTALHIWTALRLQGFRLIRILLYGWSARSLTTFADLNRRKCWDSLLCWSEWWCSKQQWWWLRRFAVEIFYRQRELPNTAKVLCGAGPGVEVTRVPSLEWKTWLNEEEQTAFFAWVKVHY